MREYDFPLRQQLTTPLAAHYLGIKPVTLRRWRRKGCGPNYVQYGRTIRYDQGVLDAWIASHVRLPGKPAQSAARNDHNVLPIHEAVKKGAFA